MKQSVKILIILWTIGCVLPAFGQEFSVTSVLDNPVPSPLLVVTAHNTPFAGKIMVDLKVANAPAQMPVTDVYLAFKQVAKVNVNEEGQVTDQNQLTTFYATVDFAMLIQTGDIQKSITLTDIPTPFVTDVDLSSFNIPNHIFALRELTFEVPFEEGFDYVVYFMLVDPQTDQVMARDLDYLAMVRPQMPGNGDNPCNCEGNGDFKPKPPCQFNDGNPNPPGQGNGCAQGNCNDQHVNPPCENNQPPAPPVNDFENPDPPAPNPNDNPITDCDVNQDGSIDGWEALNCRQHAPGHQDGNQNVNDPPVPGQQGNPCDLDGNGTVEDWEAQECQGQPSVNGNDNNQNGQPNNPPHNGQDNEKVTICHKGHTITVSINALDAHLNHGDSIGACDE